MITKIQKLKIKDLIKVKGLFFPLLEQKNYLNLKKKLIMKLKENILYIKKNSFVINQKKIFKIKLNNINKILEKLKVLENYIIHI